VLSSVQVVEGQAFVPAAMSGVAVRRGTFPMAVACVARAAAGLLGAIAGSRVIDGPVEHHYAFSASAGYRFRTTLHDREGVFREARGRVAEAQTFCAGVDGGSRAIKIVLMDALTSECVASGIADQGVRHDELASNLMDGLLAERSLDRSCVRYTVATGYARNVISWADATVTEITCHAVGVRSVAPGAATVVEIGGQDSKFLRLSPDGTVQDFSMNDRCAAGTGRFLEVVASRLGRSLGELGSMAAASRNPAAISSTCVVFAETEITGLLAQNTSPEDIVAGIQRSIASRIGALAGRRATEPIVFTGGVALVSGMREALSEVLGSPVTTVRDPQMTGALGAALVAARRFRAAGG
jgi:predicted CoA-substrate-specific enzyme activase